MFAPGCPQRSDGRAVGCGHPGACLGGWWWLGAAHPVWTAGHLWGGVLPAHNGHATRSGADAAPTTATRRLTNQPTAVDGAATHTRRPRRDRTRWTQTSTTPPILNTNQLIEQGGQSCDPHPEPSPSAKRCQSSPPVSAAVYVLLPEMRPILALFAIILCITAAYAWSQTRTWSPQARAAAHTAGQALSWILTCAGHILRIAGLIIRAILWAASLLAFLSIVGYALGLCGDGNRRYR